MLVSKTSGRGSIPRGPAKVNEIRHDLSHVVFRLASDLRHLRTLAGGTAMPEASELGSKVLIILGILGLK